MRAALYEPLNVYKPLARNIGIVDGPFEYFTVAGLRMPMPFSTRMTVVRLSNGDLFLHSPTAYDEGLAVELRRMGQFDTSYRPISGTMPISGNGKRPFPKRLRGLHPVFVGGPQLGTSKSISRES